jgi:hypothetical protein
MLGYIRRFSDTAHAMAALVGEQASHTVVHLQYVAVLEQQLVQLGLYAPAGRATRICIVDYLQGLAAFDCIIRLAGRCGWYLAPPARRCTQRAEGLWFRVELVHRDE